MKIIETHELLGKKYQKTFRIIKKGVFWILINEEAFFIAELLHFKITALDKQNIKIGFPDSSKQKWIDIFDQKGFGYVIYDPKMEYEFHKKGSYFCGLNFEEYSLTKSRILCLKDFGLEAKHQKNFLLKEKYEKLYFDFLDLIMRVTTKERFHIRNFIEQRFLTVLDLIYKYMYNLGERSFLIQEVFSQTLVIREFLRFLYKRGVFKKDTVFLDFSGNILEILKICKGIIKKGIGEKQ